MDQQTQKNKLDLLNEQFRNKQEEDALKAEEGEKEEKEEKEEEKKSIFTTIKKYKFVFLVIILVPVCMVGYFLWKSSINDTSTIPKGLPEAEAEKWKSKEKDKELVFISLNTNLTMKQGDKEANLSLINPPYSAYDFRITIVLKNDPETVLYESDLVKPETFYQTVEFQESLSTGNYDAVVYYTFYKETEDDVLGTYDVPITIKVTA